MKCSKCEFITRGRDLYCPRCGNPLGEIKYYDKNICLFNCLYISVRKLVDLIAFNLVIILMLTELIIKNYNGANYHIYPWVFLGIFLLLFILFDLSNYKNSKLFMFKLFLIFVGFLVLFIISYYESTFFDKLDIVQLIIGAIIPIFLVVFVLLELVYSIAIKNFDILAAYFYGALALVTSSVNFGLSFIDSFKIGDILALRIINIASFLFICIFIIDAIVLGQSKLKNRYNREEYLK